MALQLQPTDNSYILDTRGYAYLKAGDYESARLDYEELFNRGEGESPYWRLGAGLTYAALGESDRAVELLEQGLAEAQDIAAPDPQLADLVALANQALADRR